MNKSTQALLSLAFLFLSSVITVDLQAAHSSVYYEDNNGLVKNSIVGAAPTKCDVPALCADAVSADADAVSAINGIPEFKAVRRNLKPFKRLNADLCDEIAQLVVMSLITDDQDKFQDSSIEGDAGQRNTQSTPQNAYYTLQDVGALRTTEHQMWLSMMRAAAFHYGEGLKKREFPNTDLMKLLLLHPNQATFLEDYPAERDGIKQHIFSALKGGKENGGKTNVMRLPRQIPAFLQNNVVDMTPIVIQDCLTALRGSESLIDRLIEKHLPHLMTEQYRGSFYSDIRKVSEDNDQNANPEAQDCWDVHDRHAATNEMKASYALFEDAMRWLNESKNLATQTQDSPLNKVRYILFPNVDARGSSILGQADALNELFTAYPLLTLVVFFADNVTAVGLSDTDRRSRSPSNTVFVTLPAHVKQVSFIGDRITCIRHEFLSGEGSLISVNINGLSQLTSIGDDFLFGADALNSLYLSQLSQLTTIGNSCVGSSNSLTSVNLNGLTNLEHIGRDFSSGSPLLTSVNISNLPNLQYIEGNFASNAPLLTSVIFCGLPGLIGVGEFFLSHANLLTALDLSGCPALTCIGNSFLSRSASLTSLDCSKLNSVTSIGDNFLLSAKSLKSLDLKSLSNLTYVGENFLYQTPSLTALWVNEASADKIRRGNDHLLKNPDLIKQLDCF